VKSGGIKREKEVAEHWRQIMRTPGIAFPGP